MTMLAWTQRQQIMKQISIRNAEYAVWEAGKRAWRELKRQKTWANWMVVGEALTSGRRHVMKIASANKPTGAQYSRAFTCWLEENRLDDVPKQDRAALLSVIANRAAIERWRETLSIGDRLALNHPRTVWRKFGAEQKPWEASQGRAADLQAERDEEQARELDEAQSRLHVAKTHIVLLERLLRKRGETPPPRPDELEGGG